LCDHQAVNIGRPSATMQSTACSRLAASKVIALDDRSEGIYQVRFLVVLLMVLYKGDGIDDLNVCMREVVVPTEQGWRI
jgi:hypothetical protein